MTSKGILADFASLKISVEDLAKAKNSAESLRVAIHYLSRPKLLAGIYPEKTANWMVSRANEVASVVSQLQPSSPVSTDYHNLTPPPCMDFLIGSGVEKAIQSTIKEIHAFEGPEAHLMHQVLESQKFTHCLNALVATIKNIVKQNPKFLDDFECNVRKRLLIWIIKEVQKAVDNNLRQQFDL